jgi:hypothetical protein
MQQRTHGITRRRNPQRRFFAARREIAIAE